MRRALPLALALLGPVLAGAVAGEARAAPVLLISVDGLRPGDVLEAEARGLKVATLRRFVTDHGKIMPARLTGANAKQQREIKKGVRRAREMGLLA
jgi:hypothetical protein